VTTFIVINIGKTFVQTTLFGKERLTRIVKTGILGMTSEPISNNPPLFRDMPLSFCSYICEEYSQIYGSTWDGITFRTDSPIIYACPIDTFELMRGGTWLPNYEKFLFESIEAMLQKYPSPLDFKRDFQKYFKSLKPQEVYPRMEKGRAKICYGLDYSQKSSWLSQVDCNEITLPKPLEIKNPRIFHSKEELSKILAP